MLVVAAIRLMCAQTLDIEHSHSLLPLISVGVSVVACILNIHWHP